MHELWGDIVAGGRRTFDCLASAGVGRGSSTVGLFVGFLVLSRMCMQVWF